jgi:hypothetical protein
MNPDELIVEARAKIIWGEEISSVRDFLISNGMSVSDADARIAEFTHERNVEIRGRGIKNILIGAVLIIGGSILLYYSHATANTPMGRVRSGKGLVGLVIVMLFGLWRLVTGIILVAWPKSDHRSIPDMEE